MTDEYRLPPSARPLHYDLTIKTDLDALTFEGFAAIDLEILEETSTIVFNANPTLKLQDITLHSDALKTETVLIASNVDEKSERVSVQFSTTLPKDSKAQLRLGWKTELTNNMMGYYYSNTEINGKTIHYALTQFEPTAARRAFPSWDEPEIKATYDISLISKKGTVSLSNMPEVSKHDIKTSEEGTETTVGKLSKLFTALKTTKETDPEWEVVKFERTPLVSSYLIAWANGPFKSKEGKYVSPISGKERPVRMWATEDIIDQTAFALTVNERALPLYEEVFGLEYPLPKLDTLVAHDFDAGAMENWGLITGRTSAYLIDEKKSDIAAKKRVASVASHEVAHQWFGNIVTMKWWDNLYLNEGFATLMGEVVILDKMFPEWAASTEFIQDHLGRALDLDSRRSSHPIEVPCPDANDINQIFDALSYSKAGSVLRMLANHVGENVFLQGVGIYLSRHKYGNSVTKNLWEGIEEATKHHGKPVDVPDLMDAWINKIGFPVLTVKETADSITVRQDRYLATGDLKAEENETLWKIPLRLLTVDGQGKPHIDPILLEKREETYKVDTSKPYKLNAGTTGVYRVSYPPERLTKLGEQAVSASSPLSLADRIGLVSDALTLAKSGVAKTSAGLSLIDKLRNEQEHLVWSGISSALSDISQIWWEEPQEVKDNLKTFTRSLFTPLVKIYGYDYPENEAPSTRQLRTLAITHAASAEDPVVLAELINRFKKFAATGDDSQIPADLERTIYINAAKFGGKDVWDVLKGIYEKPKTPGARISAGLALTRTEDPELIERGLGYLATDVKTQDVMYWIVGFNANHKSRRRLLQYVKENFDALYKRFEGNFSLGNVIKYTLTNLSKKQDLEDTEAFFKDKDVSKYKMALLQSYDAIRANGLWLESKDDVAKWLADWVAKNKN